MAGYGGASSSGGSRGDGGSGGAFMGGGLQTGKTWNGTRATFSGGSLRGFSNGPVAAGYNTGYGQAASTGGAQGQGGSNTYNRNVGGMMGPRRQDAMPYPGGYAQPVLSQPIPPPVAPPVAPPVQPVPVAAPPPVAPPAFPQPVGYSWYDSLRSAIPPGNDFTGFGNQTGFGTTVNKNNLGAPANTPQSRNTSGMGR